MYFPSPPPPPLLRGPQVEEALVTEPYGRAQILPHLYYCLEHPCIGVTVTIAS